MIALLAALASERSSAVESPIRRGVFAFHYEQPLSRAQLEWYSRFNILVTHDPLPPEQVRFLHRRGTKLVLYEWAVAFYETRADEWQRSLLTRSRTALLHEKPLRGGVGSATADAWYFDPASASHLQERARSIAERLRRIGYDGVFLDTTSVQSVHEIARAEFAKRHPGREYDAAYARFLAALRKELRGGTIFTNQGFRAAEHYLPHADWDLTESLLTYPRDGKFEMRPWNSAAEPWNSIHFLMLNMVGPARKRFPLVRFANLNYVTGTNARTVQDVWAISRMFDSEGYVAGTALEEEQSDVYHRDLGAPTAARVDSPTAQASYRVFERGIIAVAARGHAVELPNPAGTRYVDGHSQSYRDAVIRLVADSHSTLTTWVLEPR